MRTFSKYMEKTHLYTHSLLKTDESYVAEVR